LTRRLRIRTTLAAAALSLVSATPAVAGPGAPELRIDASCAGDAITGSLSLRGATKGETYRVDLSYRPRKSPNWKSTGRSASFTSDGHPGTYAYSFDVSAFDAKLYRLDVAGDHAWSRTIPAASCAPGRQVPESPLAIFLPLSLLGTSALLFTRRRRSS
jgi:hypothetical protein